MEKEGMGEKEKEGKRRGWKDDKREQKGSGRGRSV